MSMTSIQAILPRNMHFATTPGNSESSNSIASGRISFVLGLQGPCVSYDTACSAALTACHAGCRAVQLGECTPGLVMGVNLILLPRTGVSFAVAGMTSVLGRSHTFDCRADGYARAEACGAVTLVGDGSQAEKGGRQEGIR